MIDWFVGIAELKPLPSLWCFVLPPLRKFYMVIDKFAGVEGVRVHDVVEASTISLIPHPATFPHS